MKSRIARIPVGTFLIFSLFPALTLMTGCKGAGETKSLILFEYVDPLEKVLSEASFFKPREALSEVVRGEHATLQFVVRAPLPIKGLRAEVTPPAAGAKSLPVPKTGFVGYVRVGRSIWDYSRDRIVSPSGYYTDPILEVESVDVGFGNTQPVWISIPIPAQADPGLYKGKITISGKLGNRNFKLSKDYSVKVYPVTVEKTSLWVTNWFSADTTQLRWLNGGRTIEPFSQKYWETIRMLEKKDPAKARDIINKVIYTFDRYDNNIEAFRIHRRNLMESLSE